MFLAKEGSRVSSLHTSEHEGPKLFESEVEEFGCTDNTITPSKEFSRKHIPYNYERISH